MKAVKDLAVLVSGAGRQQDSITSSTELTEDDKFRVKYVFAKFIAHYGNAFASQLADKRTAELMKREWGMKLRGLTQEQLDRGIELMGGDFAPGLNEYRRLCRTPVAPCHKEFPKALPKPPADKAKAKAALEEMRRKLSGK